MFSSYILKNVQRLSGMRKFFCVIFFIYLTLSRVARTSVSSTNILLAPS